MNQQGDGDKRGRRSFLSWGLMLAGLGVSYSAAAVFAVRFLVPAKRRQAPHKVYLTALSALPRVGSASFELPSGTIALVARTPKGPIALSNQCPHLGCKVSWVERRQEFFCPCHGGAFDSSGRATAGPPAAEGKNLQAFPLEVVGDAVFALIEEA